MSQWILYFRRCFVVACHTALFATSLSLAFLLRLEFTLSDSMAALLQQSLWACVAVKVGVCLLFGLDHGWWRYVGLPDLRRVFFANCVASLVFAGYAVIVFGRSYPRSVYIIDFLLSFLFTAGARFAVRLYNESFLHDFAKSKSKGVLIYGAGTTGAALVREIKSDRSLGYHVLGLIDDDPKKWGRSMMEVPVLGPGSEVSKFVERFKRQKPNVEEVIMAMPSATSKQMREAVAVCRASGVSCKMVPGMGELLRGQILATQIRKPSLADLLGREPVKLEPNRIRETIERRSVMVTGGAGSIGSELCRQIANFDPRVLVIFDQAESDLYRIELELRDRHPSLNIQAEIGDIREMDRLSEVMRRHGVESIYHAAAYKHVPLMEHNIQEAVKNNVIGTWNVVRAAAARSVSRFVLISSDKAVNPSSIMGVTKRISELIISAVATSTNGWPHKYVAVRFGNVLGSNGSVIPLFERQIAAGGPVTVTHPEVRRYFMTIREAVQLVLQASTMGKCAEIFLLDMGEPLKIVDVARNMIRLSGLEPDEDIEIKYIGLRPGEKLFEELITDGENIVPTIHEKIKVFESPSVSLESIKRWLREVEELLATGDDTALLVHLQVLVPEYQTGSRPVLRDVLTRVQGAV